MSQPSVEKIAEYPIRSMIVAPSDHLLVNFDLAQAESWIVAFLADEPKMKFALAHGDFHHETAFKALYTNVNPSLLDALEYKAARYMGKQYNHASAYRMGAYKAAELINSKSDKPPYITVTYGESKKFSTQWHSYYNVKDWWGEIEIQLSKNRTLITPYGRRREFFGHWGEELFKKATADVPQSTIADHLNGAQQPDGPEGGLIKVHEKLGNVIKIINQSHDSILFEVHKSVVVDICEEVHSYLLRPIIIDGEECLVPVDCEIGERWGELEKQERKTGSYEIKYAA